MDSIYIQKVLDGDHRAYRYFIDQYRDMAYSLAISIVKNAPLAEEVTQDAFIKAFKSLAGFEQRSKFSTWLYKIVTNEALKKVKKKSLDYTYDYEEIQSADYSSINQSIAELADQDQKYYINLVLKILRETVDSNDDALKDPKPQALFSDFGDSSLNFRLRFWVPFELGLTSKSDVSVALYNAFAEQGIEIPFPQRDIHIKTIPPESGEDGSSNPNPKPGSNLTPPA